MIKVLQWNTGGMGREMMAEITDVAERYNTDILLLQEVNQNMKSNYQGNAFT